MQSNKQKKIITPEIPISVLSTTQTDYGSTTATPSTSFNELTRQSADGDDYQSAVESRFSSRSERIGSDVTTKSHTGFGYQNLNETTTTTLPGSVDSRLPSFVNLPVSAGRFHRFPMDSGSTKAAHHQRDHRLKILEHTLNLLNHVCIGFVTIYMSWLCLRMGLAGTALHAWLVTIGFAFLMAEGVMCHYPANILTFSFQRDTKTKLHWILQALGGSLGMIGALIKLVQKGFLLTTTHGQLGFAAFLLCLFSMLTGLSALYSIRLKQLLSPLFNKTIHNLVGFAAFFFGSLAQFYGYRTGFFIRKTEVDFQTLIKVITLISLTLNCIGPTKSLFKKLNMIVNQYIK